MTSVIAEHPLEKGCPPSWASEWGEDRYGVFAAFQIGQVTQRCRFIPPGIFWMGSPESEKERFSWEGPRHLVELTLGFWLAETPCTQELWQEVMGENPSRFQSDRRPVEQVSWDDCQDFLAALNERIPELGARLPTEAQWEYACRAGTETSIWAGNLEIIGTCNAPMLHEIAWYGGNSGVDFDLAEGYDSSDWPEKQFDHQLAGTREVALKRSNPWGLYDMLGNVWEWCADWWQDKHSEGEAVDPNGPHEGTYRVLRGGSWLLRARYVRAAARDWFDPGDRDSDLGFRLALGQSRGAEGAEPQESPAGARSEGARRGTSPRPRQPPAGSR